MSKYPSTPSFGVSWPIQGQPSAPQYFPPPFHPIDGDDDDIIRDGRQVSQYLMQQNNAAFFQNTNLPSFNTAVALGKPHLRYDGEKTYSYQHVPESSTQQLMQGPSRGSHSPVLHTHASNEHLQELASSDHNNHNISSTHGVEEGELSEGEFEDIPLKNMQLPMPMDYTSINYGKQESFESYRGAHKSTSREPVYASKLDDEYSPSQPLTDAYGRSLDLHRQRSKSYSPQPAPVEPQPITSLLSQAVHLQPILDYEYQYDPTVYSKKHETPVKSLVDANTEAQRAILNLYPLKVRFQDYINEGIDPGVVQKQFEAVGLPVTSTVDADSKLINLNGEERKDRIARLIAEKTKNTPSPVSTSQNTAAKADKERMLRLKMEALQKSREQRAQKAASKIPSSSQTSNSAQSEIPQPSLKDLIPQVPLQVVVATNIGQDRQSIPGLFLSANKNTPPELYAALQTQVIKPRKRPIASDFDSMSTSTQHKRPFGQNRSDQPLVIDVSDEESDDDIDNGMNEGLVVDHSLLTNPPSMNNPSNLSDSPARKPVLASGVNTPPIQFQVKPFTSTPVDLHKKEMEIEEMKKRIAEAERRKKAKQTNSGSQTPARDDTKSSPLKTVSATSILSTVEASTHKDHLMDVTSKHIDVSEADAEAEAEAGALRKQLRRAEIASNLPTVEAEVQKSQKRLDALKTEIAQLEAVVRRGLDQKQILADEMEKLDSDGNSQFEASENKTREEHSRAQQSSTPKIGAFAQLNRLPSTSFASSPVLELDDGDAEMDIEEEQSPTEDLSQVHNFLPADELSISGSKPQAADVAVDGLNNGFSDPQMTNNLQVESYYTPDPKEIALVSTVSPDTFDGHANPNSDICEPPEDVSIPLDSPPFSPAPPENTGAGSLKDEVDSGLDVQVTPTFQGQPLALGVRFPSQKGDGIETKISDSEFLYTKYESPLKYFRAYRFHPDFEKEVSGGFKSLTYSNNISVDQELCRYELAGGVCNDSTCEFQHFKTMGLADDTILVELGNSAGYSEEEKPRFVSGLRSVLQELRVNKTRDFETIASSIAAYRAQFLGDRSRVLSL